ncbi:MAG: capsular biosynthesis protein CpsI [Syntrophobacterales bacterium CG_4_8_14_3_um_filter_49_14]|nr:MAG: capsular biosynthesis protein CpsI [Syntrophobacterales bacterium CG_4_8_14_3_um_filter_49_14]
MRKLLVTGVAGFIGFHLCKRLLEDGKTVVGLDNLNPYYDVQLKKDRLNRLKSFDKFHFVRLDLSNRKGMENLFAENGFECVVNLAAQAGVRYSLKNPHAYIQSNLVGFLNILEGCRHNKVKHLVFASSSSVYGLNTKMPFSMHDSVDHPVSLYAATKKANELMAHSYSYLYALPTTGLRFFTVYGPWGRPDMALFLFTKAILTGESIQVFNHGNMERDFTYIDDVTEGVVRIMDKVPTENAAWKSEKPDPGTSKAPYRIYNIGNNRPVKLMDFIAAIEEALGQKAVKEFLPLQLGDVAKTYADVDDLIRDVGFKPSTSINSGIRKFVEWYLAYYKIRALSPICPHLSHFVQRRQTEQPNE